MNEAAEQADLRTSDDICSSDHIPIRDAVRRRYAAAAALAATGETDRARAAAECSACCSDTLPGSTDEEGRVVFGGELYDPEVADDATEAALGASLGCGVPTAVADLRPGETVLDLGSGAGADVLLSARRVGPTGKAVGLDMTTEMLELARANAARAGVANVEFLQGYLEDIPLPDAGFDVVISNCVINLAADKLKVLGEAARVLRPGGRFAVSDVVADPEMDDATRADTESWTGCIAGALTAEQYREALAAAGLSDVSITTTHRVHAHAASAIIRATKPDGEVRNIAPKR
ncbi:MAG: arsenite methyltransferase [Actinomycetota bacterium]|nr:arsenite methyltransferase [Actinomycetota bacterium]